MIDLDTLKNEVKNFMGSNELLVRNNILLHTQKAENIIQSNSKDVAMTLLNVSNCDLFEDIVGCLTDEFELVVNIDVNFATKKDWIYLLNKLREYS